MKSFIWVLAAWATVSSIGGCAQSDSHPGSGVAGRTSSTVIAASEPNITLKGTLAYRAQCRDGSAARFQGRGDLGASTGRLYLIDRTGAIVATPSVPGFDGSFKLNLPYRGEFALKIEAGPLRRFWRDGPRTAIPVNIPRTSKAKEYQLGTICIDADPPKSFVLHTVWGNTVTTAVAGATLHVQGAAVTLAVEALPPSSFAPIVRWYASSGTVAATATTTAVWSNAVGPGTLHVMLGDGLGAVTEVTVPVVAHRFHLSASEIGSVTNFALPLTDSMADVRVSGASVTWQQTAAGLGVQLAASQERGEADVSMVPVAPGDFVQVSAMLTIDRLERGTEFSLALSGDTRPAIKLAIRNDVGRLAKRITLADGSSMEQNIEAMWWDGRTVWMQLSYDRRTGLITGEDSLSSHSLVVSGTLGEGMLTPVAGVGRYGDGAAAIELASVATSAKSLVLAGGVFADDGLRCVTSAEMTCRSLEGGALFLVAQTRAQVLNVVETPTAKWLTPGISAPDGAPASNVVEGALYPLPGGMEYLY